MVVQVCDYCGMLMGVTESIVKIRMWCSDACHAQKEEEESI